MKRKTILTLSAAVTAAVVGAIAIPAIAAGPGDWGPQRMIGMMHGNQAGFMQDHGGAGMTPGMMPGMNPGMMMQHGDHGAMGIGGMTDNPVYQSFDADKNGTVSPAELETGIAALHAQHDADGNGTLSPEEFAALFADVTRSHAERPFAMLDADGDGQISAEEMAFPAQMMARMQMLHGTATDQQ